MRRVEKGVRERRAILRTDGGKLSAMPFFSDCYDFINDAFDVIEITSISASDTAQIP